MTAKIAEFPGKEEIVGAPATRVVVNLATTAPEDAPMIVAAAIRYVGLVFSMPSPARHSDILRALYRLNCGAAIDGEQGFLTSGGVFMNRIEAMDAVIRRGQPVKRPTYSPQLFSEDLW